MNPGICYLYEYKNNQKLRNVGFMKITSHFRSCILQINARGVPVETGESIKIHAFYEKASDYIVKPIADIACGDKAIYERLTTNEASYPDSKSLENIGGFLLMINGHYYAAMSDNAAFDTSRIKMWEEPASAAETEAENMAYDAAEREAQPPDSGSYISETESVDANIYKSQTIQDEANVSIEDSKPVDNDVYMTEAAPVDVNISPAQTEPSYDDFYVTEAGHTDNNISETEAGFVRDTCPNYETQPENAAAPSDIDALNLKEEEPHENVRKIQRCDLSILPRKCWNLANNSFLMHGYHNYNHLLLVEEDGHFWLGVPGIYAAREAKAAELFGFPQFTQTYINQLDLTEDERNTSERFGHWCRYIK